MRNIDISNPNLCMRGSCDEDSFVILLRNCFLFIFVFVLNVFVEVGDQEQGQSDAQEHGDQAERQAQEVEQGAGSLLHAERSDHSHYHKILTTSCKSS